MRAPGFLPFAQLLHLREKVVRGKNASQYVTKSSVAAFDGCKVEIPWLLTLRRTFAIYATCVSTEKGTEPEAPAALGPKKSC